MRTLQKRGGGISGPRNWDCRCKGRGGICRVDRDRRVCFRRMGHDG